MKQRNELGWHTGGEEGIEQRCRQLWQRRVRRAKQAYVDLTSAALKGGRMPGALSKARSAALSAVGDDTVVANAIGVMSMFNGRQ